jgi:23S rRNA (guanosine2251-2'-O)-methyltransferase
MSNLVLVAHNLRSAHNVGSLLRTADGLGVRRLELTGYTPYPASEADERLPHEAQRVDRQIIKTALGAEQTVRWRHSADIDSVLAELRNEGYVIAGLEQTLSSQLLPDYQPPAKLALIVGREVEGLEASVLAQCDIVLQIPMRGQKESFNVSQAAAMALYHLTYYHR